MTTFTTTTVTPPGTTILDILEERGITQQKLANEMYVTDEFISLLIDGKAAITTEIALNLQRVLGGSANFWVAREAKYRGFFQTLTSDSNVEQTSQVSN